MTVKDFIGQFSHNNEMWVENKENYSMYHKYREDEDLQDGVLMDWELPHTSIADCEVICIANVIHPGCLPAITLRVDTDAKVIEFKKEFVTPHNSPLWLYERVHNLKVIASEININN